jgi:hypothetical protein
LRKTRRAVIVGVRPQRGARLDDPDYDKRENGVDEIRPSIGFLTYNEIEGSGSILSLFMLVYGEIFDYIDEQINNRRK